MPKRARGPQKMYIFTVIRHDPACHFPFRIPGSRRRFGRITVITRHFANPKTNRTEMCRLRYHDGIRNVLTGCVLREAIAYYAVHFEVVCVLRIAYWQPHSQTALRRPTYCVLRIAYWQPHSQIALRRPTYCVFVKP